MTFTYKHYVFRVLTDCCGYEGCSRFKMLQYISHRVVVNVNVQSSIGRDTLRQVGENIQQGNDMGYAQLFKLRAISGCPIVGQVELVGDKASKSNGFGSNVVSNRRWLMWITLHWRVRSCN